jgi:phage shock protein PspC (stress-responsive transcriptional regulator)
MKNEKIILGVCLWLSRRFNLSVTGLRIVFAATCLLGIRMPVIDILPLVIYIALYLIMPKNQF